VTLPEVVTGDLTGKFSEISLYNQHADFKLGSASNSNSTSPWAIACELAIESSCANSPLHEHFPYGLCNARPTRRLFLRAGPGKRSSSSTTQTPTLSPATTRTPTPSLATTRTPPSSSTSGRTLMSPSLRTTRLRNRCQDQLPAWL
jgi:hypothetical protein